MDDEIYLRQQELKREAEEEAVRKRIQRRRAAEAQKQAERKNEGSKPQGRQELDPDLPKRPWRQEPEPYAPDRNAPPLSTGNVRQPAKALPKRDIWEGFGKPKQKDSALPTVIFFMVLIGCALGMILTWIMRSLGGS